MSKRVVRGFAWSFAGSGTSVLVLLGYTAGTARLVGPGSFGRYAIAMTVIALFGYVANAGLATCLLHADRLTRPLLISALTVAAATGVGCCALVQLTASALPANHEALTLLRLLSFQLLLQPASSAALAALRRAERSRTAALLETCSCAVGCASGLALLARGWRPWGLVVATPAACVVVLLGAALLLPPRRLPTGPAVPVRELLGHSSFFVWYGLVQSATNNAPLWCANALLGPAATGQLSRASLTTGIPLTALVQGLQRAAAPVLAESRATGIGQLPEQAMQDLLCATSAASFIVFGAIAGVGPDALRLLLGPGWDTAAALVPMLALGASCALLCSTGNSLDQMRRAPLASVASQAAVIVGTCAAVVAAAFTHNLTVLALASAAPALGHALQLSRWQAGGVVAARPLLYAHAVHAALGAALFAAGRLAATDRPPLTAAICSAAAVLLTAVACWPLRHHIPAGQVALRRGLFSTRHEESPCTSASPAR